jgi:amino acid transporter
MRWLCWLPIRSQIALAGGIGLGFKIFGKTPFRRSVVVDLCTDLDFFEALNAHYRTEEEATPKTLPDRIMAKVFWIEVKTAIS